MHYCGNRALNSQGATPHSQPEELCTPNFPGLIVLFLRNNFYPITGIVKLSILTGILLLQGRVFPSGPVTFRDSLDIEFNQLLDTALNKLNMNRTDLWMPADAVPFDRHRLSRIEGFFSNPVMGLERAGDYAALARDSLPAFYSMVLSDLDMGPYQKLELQKSNTDTSQSYPLTAEIRDALNVPEVAEMLPYMNSVIQTAEVIKRIRDSLDTAIVRKVVEYADSILMMSEDYEDLNVFELKEAEERELRLARDFFQAAGEIYLKHLFVAGFSLYEEVRGLVSGDGGPSKAGRSQVKTGMTIQDAPLENSCVIWDTPHGRIALGGRGDDLYQGDFFMILDPGGNDKYLLSPLSKHQAFSLPVRCIVDLGGDDTYLAGGFSLGSGFFGVSMLIDKSGNDRYMAGDFSLGSGLFGLGILDDAQGNDIYSGGFCTQGSGAFGIGLLLEQGGNDVYTCHAQAQGFGFTRGFGALVEWKGNDSYLTASHFQDFLRYESHFLAFTQGAGLGYRPVASGGIGVLLDLRGKDSYTSDIFGQGTGYWYALGALFDKQGDDQYQAHQYAQGAGVHLAHGILRDMEGNDKYRSHGVSQGSGHDIAFGALLDQAGDDEYTAFGLSQGGGNADAVSLFVDVKGNDAYLAKTSGNMMGFSDFRRDYGMIGVFAEGGGKDLYGDTLLNNQGRIKSTFGVFLDHNMFASSPALGDVSHLTPPDSLLAPLAKSIDSLFIQASAAPEKFRYNVLPARDAIEAMGAEDGVISFLAGKLSTESARERHALRDLLGRLHKKDTVAIVRLLSDSLRSRNRKTLSMCADLCGRTKASLCLKDLAPFLKDSSWNLRAMAARNIGKTGRVEWAAALGNMLRDPHPHVCMRAAYGLGLLFPQDLLDLLPGAMDHKHQLVRNSLVQGIIRRKRNVEMRFIRDALYRVRSLAGKKALTLLIPHAPETRRSRKMYKKLVREFPRDIREAMYHAVMASDSEFWKSTARKYNKRKP
ncbi:HEAT repeat domain-containing protein [Fibrobacterota bacterium]